MGWEKQKGVVGERGGRWKVEATKEGMNGQFNIERNDSSWRFEGQQLRSEVQRSALHVS